MTARNETNETSQPSARDELADLRTIQSTLDQTERRFRKVFGRSPPPLWEEDWSKVKDDIQAMRQAGITDFHGHFRNHPDASAAV